MYRRIIGVVAVCCWYVMKRRVIMTVGEFGFCSWSVVIGWVSAGGSGICEGGVSFMVFRESDMVGGCSCCVSISSC